MIKVYLLALFCTLILSGCISIPETAREIREGKQERAKLQGIDASNINLSSSALKKQVLSSLADFYVDLEFNPKGEALNIVALKDLWGAREARLVKNQTVALVEKLFPKQEAVDDDADAFRHAYFSFQLSRKLGTARTKKFTDAYEISNINKIGGRCMDLWNNREGRRMFEETKNQKLSDTLIQELIFEKIKMGELVTEPFKIDY